MSQDEKFWRASLAGERPNVVDGQPEYGFYRQKYLNRKNEQVDNPVAVWKDGDRWIAKVSHLEITDPEEVWKVFFSACKRPVKYAHYESALRGNGWPTDLPAEAKAPPAKGSVPGDNAPPEEGQSEDPLEQLQQELKAAWSSCLDWLKAHCLDEAQTAKAGKNVYVIATKDQADKAANFKTRFGEIEQKIEAARKIAKEPFLEGGRKVDKTYGAARDSAAGSKNRMAEIIKPFDDEQRRLAKEAADKANAAARAAGGGDVVQPAKQTYGGGNGRRVAPREIKCVEITDLEAVKKAFMATKRFEEAARDWAMSVGPTADPAIPGTRQFTDTRIS